MKLYYPWISGPLRVSCKDADIVSDFPIAFEQFRHTGNFTEDIIRQNSAMILCLKRLASDIMEHCLLGKHMPLMQNLSPNPLKENCSHDPSLHNASPT